MAQTDPRKLIPHTVYRINIDMSDCVVGEIIRVIPVPKTPALYQVVDSKTLEKQNDRISFAKNRTRLAASRR